MLHVMFLSLITKITGDYQATTLLGSGLGMFIYILIESERGMLVIPLTWILAWYARHPSYLGMGLACASSPALGKCFSLAIKAAKPKA